MGGLPLNESVWNTLLKECDVNQDGMVKKILTHNSLFELKFSSCFFTFCSIINHWLFWILNQFHSFCYFCYFC